MRIECYWDTAASNQIQQPLIPLKMSSSPSQVSPEQCAQLREVADLMSKIYETLAEMRYLNPKGIIYGPHDVSKLEETFTKHNLDPAIIYLYSILPYIDEHGGVTDFFHGGRFTDFRNPDEVGRGRDPLYHFMDPPEGDFDVKKGHYMRPWTTPLSQLGNHGTVILYDARKHRIWCVDQEWWDTTDPGLAADESLRGPPHERPKSDWGDDSTEDYEEAEEDASDGSEGSSEFWSDDDDLSALAEQEVIQLHEDQLNEDLSFDEGFEILSETEQQEAEYAVGRDLNSYDHIKSRPAGDVLRDMNRWYRELRERPGRHEYGGEWQLNNLESLYLKNGWPDNFNGEGFEIDQARAYAAERAKYSAEEPLRAVEKYKMWQECSDRDIQRAEQKIKDSETDDAKWLAKFELWKAEQRKERNVEDLRKAIQQAKERCPGGICQREEDLPLWEFEELSAQMRGEQEASICSKAYEAAKADVERLCKGRTFAEAIGFKLHEQSDAKTAIETSKKWITFFEKEIEKVKKWGAQLTAAMKGATKAVENEVAGYEKAIDRNRKDIEERRKRLVDIRNIE